MRILRNSCGGTNGKGLLVSLTLFILLGCGAVYSAEPEFKEKAMACQQDLERINQWRAMMPGQKRGTLEAFEEFADSIDNKWARIDPDCHARVILAICGVLTSGEFSEQRQYRLARRYALSALRGADIISLDQEIGLTGFVLVQRRDMDVLVFQENRRIDTEVRLHAWKRLIDAASDSSWNEEQALADVSGNVQPPNGAPAGVSPESIEDEAVRAAYEKRILENQRKIAAISEHARIQIWLKEYPKKAEDYIVSVYSQSPSDLQELERMLGSFVIGDAAKRRVMRASGDTH